MFIYYPIYRQGVFNHIEFMICISNNRNISLIIQPWPNLNNGLTHYGPVTQYEGGSMLCKNPIFIFHYEIIPPN